MLRPSNKRLVRSLSLESSGPDRFPVIDVARSGGARFRNPTLEELRYVYAFMKAIALVHPLLELAENVAPRRGRIVSFEPLIETIDVQWPPEICKGTADLVAVTISHPPGQAYEEKKQGSTPKKYLEMVTEEVLEVEGTTDWVVVKRCAVCDKDVDKDQSCFCGQCHAVVYCSPVCQKQHWKEGHKSICGLYKSMMEREEELAMNIFTFSCFVEHPCKWLESVDLHHKGMWRRMCNCYSHSPFGLLSGDVSDEFLSDVAFTNVAQSPILLSGWSEYYNLRSLPMSNPVAVILSHPLTVYHILTNLVMSCKNRLIKGKEVVVHYLGPEGELDWMPAFAEISHLLNGLGSIHIVMIGPEVPSNLSGKFVEVSGRVRVNVVKGIYQEESSYLSSPHVVVALNCGLESYASWGGALELIKSMNVPVFFTDQSEILCANAKQVLRGVGLQITHPVTPNPFRSPLKDQAPSSNLPSFSNGFLFGANR